MTTRVFQRLLEERGIDESFLHPKYENLSDPFELPEMEAAVTRLKKAAEGHEKVIVYGDYDVDGVTASAEMAEILELIGVSDVEVMLPNRFQDGYGMSRKVVERAKKTGATLVATVDCGSNNGEVITELSKNGVDVVVTDHHEVSGELPKAVVKAGEPGGMVVVVNPKRDAFRKRVLQRQAEMLMAEEDGGTKQGAGKKDISGLLELCGAGVVFMVARACVEKGWIKKGREKWMLDLAAIGTVCDSMKLISDNRIICHYGMIVVEKTAKVGLRELMRVAGTREVNADAIGYQIGPRLNAAGRMETADLALKLLRTKSWPEAAKLAKMLNDLNMERKRQQIEATIAVAKQGVGAERVLVVQGPWHEGVLGIIAGRLVESYRRPCFVISSKNGKGSGRSFGDFNLALALSECQDLVEKGGGHAEACGVTVKKGKFEEFRKRMNDYYDKLRLSDQERYLLKTEDLAIEGLDDLSLDLCDEIKLLEPFGMGNPEPVFLIKRALITEVRLMGQDQQHLAVVISGGGEKALKLVSFFAPEEWKKLENGEVADIWISLMINEWRGEKLVEGKILRVEPVDLEGTF